MHDSDHILDDSKLLLANPILFVSDEAFCVPFMNFDPSKYIEILSVKVEELRQLIKYYPAVEKRVDKINIEVHESPVQYRQRCRFAVFKRAILFGDTCSCPENLLYAMWKQGAPAVCMERFPIASPLIYTSMPIVLNFINSNPTLKENLRAIYYLSTTVGDLIITLHYDAYVMHDDRWSQEVQHLRTQCQTSIPILRDISIIGRSKSKKLLIGNGFVTEELKLTDGTMLKYIQVEDGFSNPNSAINNKALNWICQAVHATTTLNSIRNLTATKTEFDLLELYCGNGNHTVAIAGYCRRVLAVEVNKKLCQAAKENLLLNNVNNVKIVDCKSEDVARRILRRQSYTDESGTYNFNAVLVDPPRCGLDVTTCTLVTGFQYIIYVSCCPTSLMRDLTKICESHEIVKFGVFDHFAFTNHLECIVFLQKLLT